MLRVQTPGTGIVTIAVLAAVDLVLSGTIFIFFILRGTAGSNDYGADPYASGEDVKPSDYPRSSSITQS